MHQLVINREERTITTSGRTFHLKPKDGDTWDVFEADRHFGWFTLQLKDGEWDVVDSETHYHTGPGAAVTAGKLGMMWAEARDERTPAP